MEWFAPALIGAGALLTWGGVHNGNARAEEKAKVQDSLIRGTEEPAPRTLLSKIFGGALEVIGLHLQLGPILLLIGLGGLIFA